MIPPATEPIFLEAAPVLPEALDSLAASFATLLVLAAFPAAPIARLAPVVAAVDATEAAEETAVLEATVDEAAEEAAVECGLGGVTLSPSGSPRRLARTVARSSALGMRISPLYR